MGSAFLYAFAAAVPVVVSLACTSARADDGAINRSVSYRGMADIPGKAAPIGGLIVDCRIAETLALFRQEPTGQRLIAFDVRASRTDLASEKIPGPSGNDFADRQVWFAHSWPIPLDSSMLHTPASNRLFRVAEKAGLPGSVPEEVKDVLWRLVKLEGKDAAADVNTNLIFHDDGTISGNGGCNRIGGSAKFEGPRVKFEEFFRTMMACDETKTRQESSFFDALPSVASYSVEGNTLRLFDTTGSTIIEFRGTS